MPEKATPGESSNAGTVVRRSNFPTVNLGEIRARRKPSNRPLTCERCKKLIRTDKEWNYVAIEYGPNHSWAQHDYDCQAENHDQKVAAADSRMPPTSSAEMPGLDAVTALWRSGKSRRDIEDVTESL